MIGEEPRRPGARPAGRRRVESRPRRPVDERVGSGRDRPRPGDRPHPRTGPRSEGATRRRARKRRDREVGPDGPHVALGVLWAAVALAATVEGPVWSAVLLAPVAGLAAASTLRSWPGEATKESRPWPVLAGLASAAIVLAASAGRSAALGVGVLAVIGVVASRFTGPARPPGLLRRALLILLPAAAGSGLVLARAQGLAEGVALVAMVSLYDTAAYLIGTGARFAVEGPIAGLASIGVLSLFLAAMPPFAGDTPWVLGALAAALAPLGPLIARRLAAHPSARVPALRRLDSLILLGPAWAAATALLLHT